MATAYVNVKRLFLQKKKIVANLFYTKSKMEILHKPIEFVSIFVRWKQFVSWILCLWLFIFSSYQPSLDVGSTDQINSEKKNMHTVANALNNIASNTWKFIVVMVYRRWLRNGFFFLCINQYYSNGNVLKGLHFPS